MDDVLDLVVREYARVELLSAYVGAVAAWVITTPVRRVVWAFLWQVWRVNREIQQLRGPAYAYALWSAVFAVPVQVLRDGEVEYGRYGRMHRSWWVAGQVTFGKYGPELLVRSARSIGRYGRAAGEACLLIGQRVFAILHGVGWLLLLLLSLTIHIPMALYDLLEFSLCGTVGGVAVVVVLNALNYLLKWTSLGLEATVSLRCLGLLTHGWRLGDGDGRLQKMAPHHLLGNAWECVLQNADDRDWSEEASLLKLQEPDVEDLDDFQPAEDELLYEEQAAPTSVARSESGVPPHFSETDVELANTLSHLAAQTSALTEMASRAQLRTLSWYH
ncbi:hypothetical protein PF010_g1512 [Phytophthora fragariae]|uniref:Uncharacterized protein n=1 Tax=Phytophthora fragariae TaxID=53985 RepID=A0A6G0M0N4_9STRA|nr:hypothetical protein PF010_g1512 [Phytophthora fragariae]